MFVAELVIRAINVITDRMEIKITGRNLINNQLNTSQLFVKLSREDWLEKNHKIKKMKFFQ
jgi:hypothetical protein